MNAKLATAKKQSPKGWVFFIEGVAA